MVEKNFLAASFFLLLPKRHQKMNAIFRRAYSTKTLIPPNVAAATKVSGASKDASITRLVSFYKVRAFNFN